jgi:hypothetical protein
LHTLAQVYLQNDYKSQQQIEKDVGEMLKEPQEEREESS